ncbi:hypothetical protein IW261DRAFT_1344262 [Armillaria novae-zelandiae]|uniref:Uncharacterized protein n=1 Tax=Armillaria novae-zelandiae TaxID=153914 RepID=A0AA39UAM3_9AGAR|nr:hypothetical protein IW261DRAFT_1344262 [Armillaria novae-zelandiae]
MYGLHTVTDPSLLSPPSCTSDNNQWFTPFLNATVCRLMNWFFATMTKTLADLDALVNDVLLTPDFQMSDLTGFDATREAKHLDNSTIPSFVSDGWTEDFVTIQLPQKGVCNKSEEDAPSMDVPGVWHRSLLNIISAAFKDPSSLDFHLKGFIQMWTTPDGHTEQVYGEAYTSDVFLDMEDKITQEPSCSLETVVVLLMVYSDSTHLANFGTAALWPAYVGIGLQSKYI